MRSISICSSGGSSSYGRVEEARGSSPSGDGPFRGRLKRYDQDKHLCVFAVKSPRLTVARWRRGPRHRFRAHHPARERDGPLPRAVRHPRRCQLSLLCAARLSSRTIRPRCPQTHGANDLPQPVGRSRSVGWLTSRERRQHPHGPGSPDRPSSASENPACGSRRQRPTSPAFLRCGASLAAVRVQQPQPALAPLVSTDRPLVDGRPQEAPIGAATAPEWCRARVWAAAVRSEPARPRRCRAGPLRLLGTACGRLNRPGRLVRLPAEFRERRTDRARLDHGSSGVAAIAGHGLHSYTGGREELADLGGVLEDVRRHAADTTGPSAATSRRRRSKRALCARCQGCGGRADASRFRWMKQCSHQFDPGPHERGARRSGAAASRHRRLPCCTRKQRILVHVHELLRVSARHFLAYDGDTLVSHAVVTTRGVSPKDSQSCAPRSSTRSRLCRPARTRAMAARPCNVSLRRSATTRSDACRPTERRSTRASDGRSGAGHSPGGATTD